LNQSVRPEKVVVLTGAGISAESGLPTFRDADGLWRNHDWRQLASPEGWRRHPELVLEFYNERRAQAAQAQPNAAHRALAELESKYEVVIVTQNVDDLHERAGSTRGTSRRQLRRHIGAAPIRIGDLCEDGTQLRPDIVWFGEAVPAMEDAAEEVAGADKVLVVGTSLTVYPAASLTGFARGDAEKVLCSPEIDTLPRGYTWLQGTAAATIPGLVRRWMNGTDD
jgi:NAD-dependent deacetylase